MPWTEIIKETVRTSVTIFPAVSEETVDVDLHGKKKYISIKYVIWLKFEQDEAI